MGQKQPTGLKFNEYCAKCSKVVPYVIELDSSEKFWVVCPSCGSRHEMRNRREIYYRETDLWVTRFTFGGNIQGVVATRLSKL